MNRNIRHATLGAVLAGGSLLAGSGFAMNELAQGYALGAAQATPPQRDAQAGEPTQADAQAPQASPTAGQAAHDAHHDAGAKPAPDPKQKPQKHKAGADKQMGEGKCGEGKCGAAV